MKSELDFVNYLKKIKTFKGLCKKKKFVLISCNKQIVKIVNNNIIQNNSFKKDNENEIFLSFTSSSWIEIYVNNELIEAQQFKAGDTYSRKVQIPFKIVVGNADSLKGTYNGEMIDFSTDNDSLYGVKTVLFDDE